MSNIKKTTEQHQQKLFNTKLTNQVNQLNSDSSKFCHHKSNLKPIKASRTIVPSPDEPVYSQLTPPDTPIITIKHRIQESPHRISRIPLPITHRSAAAFSQQQNI